MLVSYISTHKFRFVRLLEIRLIVIHSFIMPFYINLLKSTNINVIQLPLSDISSRMTIVLYCWTTSVSSGVWKRIKNGRPSSVSSYKSKSKRNETLIINHGINFGRTSQLNAYISSPKYNLTFSQDYWLI